MEWNLSEQEKEPVEITNPRDKNCKSNTNEKQKPEEQKPKNQMPKNAFE